ncbi:MAG: PaaI family thioesterase [Gammaproteobacteria bacterium]|nr:PaaI family thioesterase [Gammaproteobacteria bacterium]
MPKTSKEQMEIFFQREFSQMDIILEDFEIDSITIRQKIGENNLRPGGTVSGPTMMSLADCAIYVAILREIGLVALAVTTSLNINFLTKPPAARDLLGTCKLLKLGKSLAIGEVSIFSEGKNDPVAHAVGTYSIPPSN